MVTENELQELASQLSHPSGLKGVEIANAMNESNIKMTHRSIDLLKVLDDERVLELGHGNCEHLGYLINQKNRLTYYGLEISELMNKEAQQVNQQFIDNNQASFHLYNGQTIPFEESYFDKIFTVNTIYFWTDPTFLISELYRVTKPKGKVNITFAQRDFMKQLPFTQFGFELYDNEKIIQLFNTTPFSIVGTDNQIDSVKTKIGDFVNREFTTITLEK